MLRYAPPAQTSPTIVDLTSTPGDYFVSSGAGNLWTPGADYTIHLSPTVPRTGLLEIDANGARHIRIIGGLWALNDALHGAKNYHIHIHNAAGSVFVEGQEADMTNTHADFLAASGGTLYTPDIYFQNSRILNLTADNSTNHADIVQPQGKIRYLFADLITFTSNYGGYTIAADGSTGNTPPAGVFLSRHNAWYSAANPVNPITAFLWINNGGGGGSDTLPFPLHISDFWIDLARGAGRSYSAFNLAAFFPNSTANSATGNTAAFTAGEAIGAQDGAGAAYAYIPDTNMLVTGIVQNGSPAIDGSVVTADTDGKGSYVQAGIGTNYVSPGYGSIHPYISSGAIRLRQS